MGHAAAGGWVFCTVWIGSSSCFLQVRTLVPVRCKPDIRRLDSQISALLFTLLSHYCKDPDCWNYLASPCLSP
ncbi:hypothetical protein BGW36DRAFT_374398 [Talaromyces proteolyticus]|uniref:Secreted protein n=1 Tax=Talaromyces proteolyticus TaxID=1131652 RepID=A0AAD4Q2P5_9EURO|nr:uncharacterized protein BGW36DRAFT_374398 [Talaromyces proteolyticus]KAH8700553.1 hypothetical protein BGW36DRAFT_374398 [Talaromyces proteolyticus]